jgi:hypothetical protein
MVFDEPPGATSLAVRHPHVRIPVGCTGGDLFFWNGVLRWPSHFYRPLSRMVMCDDLTLQSRPNVQRPRRGRSELDYVLIDVVALRAFEGSKIKPRFVRLDANQDHRCSTLGTRLWFRLGQHVD